MKILTLLNEKGGVGKTTVTITLAAMLAEQGYKCLIVDTDSQGHATVAVRQKKAPGLFNLLANDADWQDVIVPVPEGYHAFEQDNPLWLLPSSESTKQLMSNLDVLSLRERLQELNTAFDFVLVDTSPAISDIHLALYIASDYIIPVTEATFLPMNGLIASIKHLTNARQALSEKGLPCADLLGILVNKFRGRESVQHQNFGWLRGKYGDSIVFEPIRALASWEKASQLRKPIFAENTRRSKAVVDAYQFRDTVLARLGATADA